MRHPRAAARLYACFACFACATFARARAIDDAARATTMDYMRASTFDDDDWRTGSADVTSLIRYNNHARRYLHACAPTEAWDAAGRFLSSLDWALAGDDGNANVLHEFNDLPTVKHLDVSLRMDYHASAKNGNLRRLAMCDAAAGRGGGDAWCMGLERSSAFARHRRWWRRLSEEYEEGRHPYWLSEYMEFDMSKGEIDPTASVFLEHLPENTGRHDEYVPALREYFKAIEARVPPRLYDNVQRVIDLVTGEGFDTSIWAAGIMFSRSVAAKDDGKIDSVRLLIHFNRHDKEATKEGDEDDDDGYRSEKTRQMVQFLEILHWDGDFDEFDRIDDYFLDDGGVGSVLQVDVLSRAPTDNAPSIIGSRVGVEITVGTVHGKNKNIMPRLGTLVSEGLADDAWWQNFTGALCAKGRPPTDAANAFSVLRRPCVVKRRTAADKRELRKPDGSGLLPMLAIAASHVKFIVQPGRPLYAKTYVVTQHSMRHCLNTVAYKTTPRGLPEYSLCVK